MLYLVAKYLVTAAMVVAISELAKRSDRFGALLAALPLVTVLTLIWLYIERVPTEKLSNHAWYTFWYVLPTLPMFLAFPHLLNRFGFWGALAACAVFCIVCFLATDFALRPFGLRLL
jgi:hypothetical protein